MHSSPILQILASNGISRFLEENGKQSGDSSDDSQRSSTNQRLSTAGGSRAATGGSGGCVDRRARLDSGTAGAGASRSGRGGRTRGLSGALSVGLSESRLGAAVGAVGVVSVAATKENEVFIRRPMRQQVINGKTDWQLQAGKEKDTSAKVR